jgi:hypothetical protein
VLKGLSLLKISHMKNIEKSLNLVYYYLCKLLYAFGKFLLVYANPFLWMANASKLKFGFKTFCLHMEKNHPTFINSYRNNYLSKICYALLLFYSIVSMSNVILYCFACNTQNVTQYLPFFGLVSTVLCAYFFVFKNDVHVAYFKTFEIQKKEIHPLLLGLIALIYAVVLITLVVYTGRSPGIL